MDERYLAVLLAAGAIACGAVCFALYQRSRRKQQNRKIEMVLAAFADQTGGNNALSAVSQGHDLATDNSDEARILRQLYKLKQLQDGLREKAEAEREEMKSVVTDIAHQLKTPVSVMDMSLSLLETESLTPEERQEFQVRLRSSLGELETLMESLIQISRMEAGLIALNPRTVPLVDTISHAVGYILLKAEEKQITISLDDAENITDAPVAHDPKWLQEAFVNILDNAIKYSPSGSSIVITPFRRNGFLRLEFADEGIGIPREERNKVLTRFYRGRNETVAAEKGSGVGLYLVNRILRLHGGMVYIHDGRGTIAGCPGTTVVVQLPCN